MMESTKQSTGSNHIVDPSVSKHSDYGYDYEDDFEELESRSNDQSESVSKMNSEPKNPAKKYVFHQGDSGPDADTHVEKGQRETSGQIPMEKDKVKQGTPTHDDLQSDDSEPEPEGDVLFTEDQQRAMMELMAQKHDSGDYSGDPPEYNVKERLKELNAELAEEPDPGDRQHKVGFKKELVDLVAPPPEISDDDCDDDSPRKTLKDEEKYDREESAGQKDTMQQFVVERDGKFEYVGEEELSALERAMLIIPDSDSDNVKENGDDRGKHSRRDQRSGSMKENVPQPPSRPRPNTAGGVPRRIHSALSPRPQTASSPGRSPVHISNYGPAMGDFNYNSPYAMSSTEKERAQERARLKEQQRKEEERQRMEEDEYRRQESEEAFQAWLQHKAVDDRRRRQEDTRGRRNGSSEDMKARENDEAFRGWLKQKQAQLKREKLLKRREEQGVKESYYVRSREECDMAYREWLKKKYAEFRQQRAVEKERQKTFVFMARKTRKQQMISRAVRQSPAFRYPDVYGYRF